VQIGSKVARADHRPHHIARSPHRHVAVELATYVELLADGGVAGIDALIGPEIARASERASTIVRAVDAYSRAEPTGLVRSFRAVEGVECL
jgi:hypothetical protein